MLSVYFSWGRYLSVLSLFMFRLAKLAYLGKLPLAVTVNCFLSICRLATYSGCTLPLARS